MKEEKIYSTAEICEIFGISRMTLSRYINVGLPRLKAGEGRSKRKNFFDLEEVKEWMEKRASQ